MLKKCSHEWMGLLSPKLFLLIQTLLENGHFCACSEIYVLQRLLLLLQVDRGRLQVGLRLRQLVLQLLHLLLQRLHLLLGLFSSHHQGKGRGKRKEKRELIGLTFCRAFSFSSRRWLAFMSFSWVWSRSFSSCCIFFCSSRTSSSAYFNWFHTQIHTICYLENYSY